jgi:hypothetical protein
MLVVFAQPWDPAGPALAAAWPGRTGIVTPRDLSHPGWRLRSGAADRAVLVAGGEAVDISEVRGVIGRLGWIAPEDLTWIDAAERDFVAAEMGAFLLAFLSQIDCPVLNRPTPLCLAGPMPLPAAWRESARKARFPLARPGAAPARTLDVIDGRVVGARFRPEAWAAERLAADCGARLLAVAVSDDGGFIGAHPFVDLANPTLACAAVSTFKTRNVA